MSVSSLPPGNYVLVAIRNDTAANGGGVGATGLFISLVDQVQAYTLTQYQNGYLAQPNSPTGGSVASFPLSQLAITGATGATAGFYLQVYNAGATGATGPIGIAGGRIYFADQPNAVPYASGPGGLSPTADFDFDFVEFAVDTANNQLNLDTTQVDQFGMPIYLQTDPIAPDYGDGTGIVPTQSRANVISEFRTYAASPGPYAAYQEVYSPTGPQRLLAPQHVIDAGPTGPSSQLARSFDEALYRLFDHYYSADGGQTLYLVGNGSHGFEIFSGQVIKNFTARDSAGATATYTVFQFAGTGYNYEGVGASLSRVAPTGPQWGRAKYQIFYPYFSDNGANSFNTALSSSSPSPYWFGGFPSQTGPTGPSNLSITSAGRMVLGASGVFADNVSQQDYYEAVGGGLPYNFDAVMLGNLENQLATMLNRGVTPDTGATALPVNLNLRTGSNSATDLIYLDLANIQTAAVALAGTGPSGAPVTSYAAAELTAAAGITGATGVSVMWNSLSGTIYYGPTAIQKFNVNPDDITQLFTLSPTALPGPSALYVQNANYVIDPEVSTIDFDWNTYAGFSQDDITIDFQFDYAPTTTEPHYATLHLFSPYGQPQVAYQSGDLGPTGGFSNGLVGASGATGGTGLDPTSGMAIMGISLSDPTYLYRVNDPQTVTIYSPQALVPLNTNILSFSSFYPVDATHQPIGQWNGYAAFFHIGDPAHQVPPPTVDGKGYAFAYDDNGGYSSDITVQLPNTSTGNSVVVTLHITLLPWKG